MKTFLLTLSGLVIFAAMTLEPSTTTQHVAPSPTHAQNCSDYPPYRCFGKTATPSSASPTPRASTATSVATTIPSTAIPATVTPRSTSIATVTPQPTARQSPPTAPTVSVGAPGVATTTSTPLSVQTPSSVAQATFVVVVRGTAVVVTGLPKSGEAPLWEER